MGFAYNWVMNNTKNDSECLTSKMSHEVAGTSSCAAGIVTSTGIGSSALLGSFFSYYIKLWNHASEPFKWGENTLPAFSTQYFYHEGTGKEDFNPVRYVSDFIKCIPTGSRDIGIICEVLRNGQPPNQVDKHFFPDSPHLQSMRLHQNQVKKDDSDK
jgi:hypothetical protein